MTTCGLFPVEPSPPGVYLFAMGAGKKLPAGKRRETTMQAHTIAISTPSSGRSAAWGAVLSMSLCVFVLIASEFLPVSLLTPIATDLAMTEGQGGQAIAVSGIFAVITSLLISQVTARIDRKRVLLSLTGLMAVSGAVTAFAPNYAVTHPARGCGRRRRVDGGNDSVRHHTWRCHRWVSLRCERLPNDLRAQCRSLGSGCGTRIRRLARGFNISGTPN